MKGPITLLYACMAVVISIFVAVGFLAYFQYRNINVPVIINDQSNTQIPADWDMAVSQAHGFSFRYPGDFVVSNQLPRVLAGACDISGFPDVCPNINDMAVQNLSAAGVDTEAVRDTVYGNDYWEFPEGEKLDTAGLPWCRYHAVNGGMGNQYDEYYYVIVRNQQCLAAYLMTSRQQCDFYLSKTDDNQSSELYQNCVARNDSQSQILDQIVSTFSFTP